MAKRESTLGNMLMALSVITLVASASLGAVYTITSEPIALAMLAKKNNAIREVIPEFNNDPSDEVYKVPVDGDTLYFYTGRLDGALVGTAVETFTMIGFSGEIRVMVGLLPDGTIHDVTVLKHAETPGLGDKMDKKKSDWSSQFRGKDPRDYRLSVKKDGGDVDAITASTISSMAFCDAVSRAYNTYVKEVQKN
ncbi:MAG: RnfABCDGE type electron transport complex subunit G [Bacteroidales bacterium]|jgi:electron transport complex protein RnfG|nr:RnfABCDGE type electron transport complex subunit G [Bacteroidales bacterium]